LTSLKKFSQIFFDKLKEALTSSSYLRLPDFTKTFEVITDASDFALRSNIAARRKGCGI
jgi:hypothetical protein